MFSTWLHVSYFPSFKYNVMWIGSKVTVALRRISTRNERPLAEDGYPLVDLSIEIVYLVTRLNLKS